MTLNESDAQKQLELTRNFLQLSRNADQCAALRSSDCIQLLVQILHSNDASEAEGGDSKGGQARQFALQALHNIVHSNPDDKAGRRELKLLRLLDQILDYSNFLRSQLQSGGEAIADDEERHPLAAVKMLMKASFDDEHRQTMCELGALKAIPNLVHLDHAVHGPAPGREQCNSLRSYALMALTNLTFGDANVHNKAYLCGQKQFMEVVIAQLDTAPDDLLQVVAGVLRNLSWRADKHMKTIFNEIGTVTALALAAMKNKSENTLKAILSALWNLSAHCSTNKAEFCAVDGALAFLVRMLSYEGPSKTLKIIENAGGILRNVSSHIAVCEPYRQILREHNCLAILLQQLKSESLTVVSNSCGTLWNLSARCPEDQQFLLDHNAIPLLRALVTSKNAMIAEGSSSALKNLVNFRAVQELAPNANGESLDTDSSASLAGTLPRRFSSMRLSSNPTGSLKKLRMPSSINAASSITPTTLPKKCESRESIYSGKSDCTKYSSKSDTAYEQRKLSKSRFEMVPTEEQPIDYSMKYSVDSGRSAKGSFEIDLDQPTDFSARYTERRPKPKQPEQTQSQAQAQPPSENSSEILLILDESASTASTSTIEAQRLAKSASACDLSTGQLQRPQTLSLRSNAMENLSSPATKRKCNNKPSGSHTPERERPINYCDEGTPGCFSRFESLNSLTDKATAKPTAVNNGNALDSAMETPLMFSRRSSMDSFVNEDIGVGACEDNGSVISDYSRMQSGVISPSELPDSPTQSMPQSPRRVRKAAANHAQQQTSQQSHLPSMAEQLKSHVFEEKLNRFQVEHTPAVFSTATSLSDLSILDEQRNAADLPFRRGAVGRSTMRAICTTNVNDVNGNQQNANDEPRSYCTEDTPALLSKACSNSNLSMLSMASNMNDINANEPTSSLPTTEAATTAAATAAPAAEEDAIAKMRCGGSALPSYLPVRDEMNKYFVEDSPCNFSVISGLSSLTVGSAQVGPARTLKEPAKPQLLPRASEPAPKLPPRRANNVEPRLPPKRNDSLSSLSIDSDDDCNLLSQAIAAGSSRPKTANDASHASTDTLPKPGSSNSQRRQTIGHGAKTDYSSDDSLDDGQSKSLFEQCILSGMHKSNDALETESMSNSSFFSHTHTASKPRQPSNTGDGKGTDSERFVSNQVRQIESMLANRPAVATPTASNSGQAQPQAESSRRHHWV